MKKLFIRLRVAFSILTGKKKHFIVINVDQKNFIEMIKGNDFDINYEWHGLQNYNVFVIIKGLSAAKDDVDMVLYKAEWEAAAIIYNQQKKK